MEFLTTLKDTPVPTILVFGGLIFLFLGIATVKKPIVIDVAPPNRKISLVLGTIFVGIGLYLILFHTTPPASITTETSTVNLIGTSTIGNTVPKTPFPRVALRVVSVNLFEKDKNNPIIRDVRLVVIVNGIKYAYPVSSPWVSSREIQDARVPLVFAGNDQYYDVSFDLQMLDGQDLITFTSGMNNAFSFPNILAFGETATYPSDDLLSGVYADIRFTVVTTEGQ